MKTPAHSPQLLAGLQALSDGQLEKAEAELSACPESSTDPETAYRLGVAQCLQGHTEEAIKTWERTLRLDACHEDTLYDLATAYVEIGNAVKAVMTYSRLLNINPNHGKGRFNLGNLLFRMGQTEDAVNIYAPLIDGPSPPRGGIINLGRALRRLGRLEEADTCYRHALISNPNDHFVHWNRSHVLCLMGQWAEGFEAWEHRLQADIKLPHTPSLPEWTGQGKAPPSFLLLVAEQGHGDTIQCLRYIPELINRGCTPVLMVHAPLISFFKNLAPNLEVIGFQDKEPEHVEMWSPLFSLPHRLSVPYPEQTKPPYLNPYFSKNLARKYPKSQKSTKDSPPQNIGLVWAGNPDHDNDQWRSIPAKLLEPLISAFPNKNWQSLQIGSGASDLADQVALGNLEPAPLINCFADTAEIISAMDLIICVDTAVAHMAGSLGIPCWMLIAAEPDWRWGQNSSTTDWYPKTQLFRQNTLGDWSNVIQKITNTLNSMEYQ